MRITQSTVKYDLQIKKPQYMSNIRQTSVEYEI